MAWLEAFFWVAVACVVYPYLIYPLALGILVKLKLRKIASPRGARRVPVIRIQNVSIVIAVHNEELTINRRIRELVGLIETLSADSEVIVVSDGSTDRTPEQVRLWTQSDLRVRMIELDGHQGKAVALTEGCALARHDIVVFADARQSWAPNSLIYLIENFADPRVGAVSGELMVETGQGVMGGVGLYWRFEKWIRRQESLVASSVGVTGAISAVRKSLFRPIPAGTILDDVYWPLGVALQGYLVRHDCRATAYDRLPERVQDEFRRKVRTLSGNFQLLGLLPEALLPSRNPVWIQYVSHKLLRLAVPWALLAMLGSSAALHGPVYLSAFWGQVAFYLLSAIGLSTRVGIRFRPAATAASFVVLNAAAWLAFWAWALGQTNRLWHKTSYRFSTLESLAR